MLIGQASTSGTSSVNRGNYGRELISEKEFKELFPDGYTDTNLLPTHKEYWAKNIGKFKHEYITSHQSIYKSLSMQINQN